MSTNKHWVLPQGIEEALPEQARRLEILRREILDLYSSWGYELVMPPFIDHIESLITGNAQDLDLQTFKLVDQTSGRTLGVRADMTPQVARIDVAQLNRDVVTRLCYIGTVLRARPDAFGGTRSPLQIGAELYGHAGPESEVEIISLMLKTFDVVGVEDVFIDMGNVDIYRALARQASLSDETERELFELLQRKAATEIDTLVHSLDIESDIKKMLLALADLNGGSEILAKAREQLKAGGKAISDALDYLQKTADLLTQRFGNLNIHFDLAELYGYHYKTGVVFAAFVENSGQAIARGGRYDDIGELFGRARAATGFSADLKMLNAMSTRAIEPVEAILSPVSDDSALVNVIEALRADGNRVIEQLPGQESDAKSLGCNKELVLEGGEWKVVEAN